MQSIQLKRNIAWATAFIVGILAYYGVIVSVDDFWFLLYQVGPIHWSILATYLVTGLAVFVFWVWRDRAIEFGWTLGIALVVGLLLLPFPPYIWAQPDLWAPRSPEFWELAIYAFLRVTLPILLLLPFGAVNSKTEYRTVLLFLLLSLLVTVFYRYYTGLYQGFGWSNGKILLNVMGGFLISLGLGSLLVPIGRLVSTRPAGIDLRS